ncbi:MAG TPA: hypothetical protein VLH38_02845 [Patescibacteria group bacterium]|nr:hypothetical protein [Patescibacteria group bacterium]
MKLYCIITRAAQKESHSYRYFEQACVQRNIELVPVQADTFDYAQDMSQFVETPSMLYRMGIGERTAILEALLFRPGVATFYNNVSYIFTRNGWGPTIMQDAAGLPTIPTVFNVARDQEDHFEQYAEHLGGFPLILKASGGSHGASVLRVDSLESLRSVVGYVADGTASFALRKYIHDATHLRMVVVGDQVVDAIRYLPQPGDFRTNAVAVPQVEAYARTDETAPYFELAIKAVAAEDIEFGGVDILLDAQGAPYIAEINFPCNFSRNQMTTDVDVAGSMIDYLLAKARLLSGGHNAA